MIQIVVRNKGTFSLAFALPRNVTIARVQQVFQYHESDAVQILSLWLNSTNTL